ncbi:hypothetical protein [Spartinivicinus ruber]|uniref:hypothetical protein n=1 Tax=Spartinivicinus ruber TaxID=2683272 RepID=UPI0013D07F86|nr:hypothetical protein [Spartinivicinus ruber]
MRGCKALQGQKVNKGVIMSFSMDIVFVGATVGSGESKKSGRKFDMATIDYAVPAEDFSNDKCVIQKAGYEVKQIDMEKALLSKLRDIPFGTKISCQLAVDPANPRRTFVTDVTVSKQKAA